MTIKTSYHAKTKQLKKLGFTVINISLYKPRFSSHDFNYLNFAPTKEMLELDLSNEAQFDKYNKMMAEKLNRLDPEKVLSDLQSFGNKLVLCCYEKDFETCHRWDVANWIKEKLDIECKEITFS